MGKNWEKNKKVISKKMPNSGIQNLFEVTKAAKMGKIWEKSWKNGQKVVKFKRKNEKQKHQ